MLREAAQRLSGGLGGNKEHREADGAHLKQGCGGSKNRSHPRSTIEGLYLSTQMEVTEQDGRLRAGDDQDDEDQEQEAKHIVHLMGPASKEELFRNFSTTASIPTVTHSSNVAIIIVFDLFYFFLNWL